MAVPAGDDARSRDMWGRRERTMLERQMSRRRVLRLAGKVAAGLGVSAAFAKQSTPAKAENCFWRKYSGPSCSGGQLLEYWCYQCCSGTSWVIEYSQGRP